MSKISFPAGGSFSKTLKERVDAYFNKKHIPKTGNLRMFLKTGIILLWLTVSYMLLVFFSSSFLMALITAFAVAQGFVLVGFNIMHDGNHGSYSKNKTVNRIMGFTLDLIGGSNLLWRQKHNIMHHTYTNIDGMDEDLETNGLLRLSPEQPWKPWHRFQHWYALPVYSLLSLSWMTFSDFKKFFSGRIGQYALKKSKVSTATLFFLTKIFYFGYMIVLPLFFHPLWQVLLGFIAIHLVLGITLSVVFQLAHTVENVTFVAPKADDRTVENEWVVHQLKTTANFARGNKFATWYLGGLNFQVEHHLFSKVCHIHYPDISRIVEQTCREFSMNYNSYPSVRAATAAHFRFLRSMSKKPLVVPA